MAGILADQVAGGAEQVAAEQQVAEQVAGEEAVAAAAESPPGLEEPTPEEQDAFSRVEVAAKMVIHDDPKSFKKIAGMLETGAKTPARTLAKVAWLVFGIVDEKAGGKIPEAVILRGIEVTLDLVIKTAEDIGAMAIDEEMANRALEEVIGMAAEEYGIEEPAGAPTDTAGMPPELVDQISKLGGGQQNGLVE